jgi:hypothetical protein
VCYALIMTTSEDLNNALLNAKVGLLKTLDDHVRGGNPNWTNVRIIAEAYALVSGSDAM